MVAEAGRDVARQAGSRRARPRILEAMLDLAAVHGYKAIDLKMVLERAGASRAEFDAHFAGMEDCALQLLDDFYPPARAQIRAAYESEESWPDTLRAAAYATADWILAHPREVRFGAVELLDVGELARARREAAFKDFVYMIDAGRTQAPDPDSLPRLTGEQTVGAMAEMLVRRLREQTLRHPAELIPELMYLAVLPYMGPEAAARELEVSPPKRGGERR